MKKFIVPFVVALSVFCLSTASIQANPKTDDSKPVAKCVCKEGVCPTDCTAGKACQKNQICKGNKNCNQNSNCNNQQPRKCNAQKGACCKQR